MKIGWQHYVTALSAAMVRAAFRTRRCLGLPHVLIAWPLYALLAFAVAHKDSGRAFRLILPASFPFQSAEAFLKRLQVNPIDAPNVIIDWIQARPFDAGLIPIYIGGIMAAAAIIEVLWLAMLLDHPYRPAIGRSLRTATCWIGLRLALATVALPLAWGAFWPIGRMVLAGMQEGQQGRLMVAVVLALVAGMWSMFVLFLWGLAESFLNHFYLPFSLMTAGTPGQALRYLGQLFRVHWRGAVLVLVADWGGRTLLAIGTAVIALIVHGLLHQSSVITDAAVAVLLLPLLIWLRLLGAAALAQVHPALAACDDLTVAQPADD